MIGENHIVVHNSDACDVVDILTRDGTGRIHIDILPTKADLQKLTKDELQHVQQELTSSIAARRANMLDLGQKGGHAKRLGEKRRLLNEVNSLLR